MDASLEAKAVSIMFLNTAKIVLASPKCLTSFYPYIFPERLSVLSMYIAYIQSVNMGSGRPPQRNVTVS